MKAFLMFPDKDFDPKMELLGVLRRFSRQKDKPFDPWKNLPWQAESLFQDLQFDLIFEAMAKNDSFLYEVARKAVLSSSTQDIGVIQFRQAVLHDCLEHPEIVRTLYALSITAVEEARDALFWMSNRSGGLSLYSSVRSMKSYIKNLHQLRTIAAQQEPYFASAGFQRFFQMVQSELTDDYFAEVHGHLRRLDFRHGVPISAEIGSMCKGKNHVLRMPKEDKGNWWKWLFGSHEESYKLTIAPRDQAGANALSEQREIGLGQVAGALCQAVEHVQSFFQMIHTELAFYVGCVNLKERLTDLGEPVCLPKAIEQSQRAFACTELYDVALSLQKSNKIVGNTIDSAKANLLVVTGANRGGKSTFLRSCGQAQLMMQAGMFVGASALCANVAAGVFTHFKREEDRSMSSGKLDEELARMSAIVDYLKPDSLVLFNESFAATNEREGSEIARQVTRALENSQVKIVHVTHLYTFSHSLLPSSERRVFFRADLNESGVPSFQLILGEPRSTSFGELIYKRYFNK